MPAGRPDPLGRAGRGAVLLRRPDGDRARRDRERAGRGLHLVPRPSATPRATTSLRAGRAASPPLVGAAAPDRASALGGVGTNDGGRRAAGRARRAGRRAGRRWPPGGAALAALRRDLAGRPSAARRCRASSVADRRRGRPAARARAARPRFRGRRRARPRSRSQQLERRCGRWADASLGPPGATGRLRRRSAARRRRGRRPRRGPARCSAAPGPGHRHVLGAAAVGLRRAGRGADLVLTGEGTLRLAVAARQGGRRGRSGRRRPGRALRGAGRAGAVGRREGCRGRRRGARTPSAAEAARCGALPAPLAGPAGPRWPTLAGRASRRTVRQPRRRTPRRDGRGWTSGRRSASPMGMTGMLRRACVGLRQATRDE